MHQSQKQSSGCFGCENMFLTRATPKIGRHNPMNYQTLEQTLTGPVATVTLNRPEVVNACNEVAIAELEDCIHALGNRDELRVIVLAARGKCFSAGADLDWISAWLNCHTKQILMMPISSLPWCGRFTPVQNQSSRGFKETPLAVE